MMKSNKDVIVPVQNEDIYQKIKPTANAFYDLV